MIRDNYKKSNDDAHSNIDIIDSLAHLLSSINWINNKPSKVKPVEKYDNKIFIFQIKDTKTDNSVEFFAKIIMQIILEVSETKFIELQDLVTSNRKHRINQEELQKTFQIKKQITNNKHYPQKMIFTYTNNHSKNRHQYKIFCRSCTHN